VAHPRESQGGALFTFVQSAEIFWPDEIGGVTRRGWEESGARGDSVMSGAVEEKELAEASPTLCKVAERLGRTIFC
jgi:hypothetical protein